MKSEDVQMMALNQEDEDSFEFEQEDHLTVDIGTLLGSGSNQKVTNTSSSHQPDLIKRVSQHRRSSTQVQDINESKVQQDNMLIEFFKNLEYRPDQSKTGTVRASYRAGDQMYNLYAIPG